MVMANLKMGNMNVPDAFAVRKMAFLWENVFQKWYILRVDIKNANFSVQMRDSSL